MQSPEFQRVFQILSRLPGMGFRSARRILLYLLKKKDHILPVLVQALQKLQDATVVCSSCYMLDTKNPCALCTDPKRDGQQICVVADVLDVWSFERSHVYRGHYHILGGVLSAVDGVTPSHLTIESLKKRTCSELILALPPTIDGQTTLHFVLQSLKEFDGKITMLGHGIPLGGDFEFLDEGTLAAAFASRKSAL